MSTSPVTACSNKPAWLFVHKRANNLACRLCTVLVNTEKEHTYSFVYVRSLLRPQPTIRCADCTRASVDVPASQTPVRRNKTLPLSLPARHHWIRGGRLVSCRSQCALSLALNKRVGHPGSSVRWATRYPPPRTLGKVHPRRRAVAASGRSSNLLRSTDLDSFPSPPPKCAVRIAQIGDPSIDGSFCLCNNGSPLVPLRQPQRHHVDILVCVCLTAHACAVRRETAPSKLPPTHTSHNGS